jgi:hypothetical protein
MLIWLGVLLAVGASMPARAAEPGTAADRLLVRPAAVVFHACAVPADRGRGFTFALPPCNV